MSATYCGRSCENCADQETLNCSGCKTGPGGGLYSACNIARCCKEKGHECCTTCGHMPHCVKYQERANASKKRIDQIESERKRQEDLQRNAEPLGKWLWLLFWLIIPSGICSLLEAEVIIAAVPEVKIPGMILSILTNLASFWILHKLSVVHSGYQRACFYSLIGYVITFLGEQLTFGADGFSFGTLLTIPGIVFSLIGMYHEIQSHADVLTGVSDLSNKWETLWKWLFGSYIALISSIVITIIIPVLGALVAIAAGISTVVAGIVKLVYLYRSAKIFREYNA